jgi:Anti-sigma factor NepR
VESRIRMTHDIRKTMNSPRSDSDHDTESDIHNPTHQPRLSPQVQAQLGQRLRVFYETLKLGEQPVPDRFIELINRLDEAQPEEKRS